MSLLQSSNFNGDFGDVAVGNTAQISFDLYSSDGGDIALIDIQVTGTGFAEVSYVGPNPLNGSSGSGLLTLSFTPPGTGVQTGTVTITSSAINNPASANLSGNGVTAGTKALSVDPGSWTFPNQKVGVASSEKILEITNTGTVNVQVTALTFSGGSIPFAIGATSPGLPATITPGNSLNFGAKFTPTVAGYVAGTVSVVSDAVASPFVVDLSGVGYLITPAYVVTDKSLKHLWAFATPDSTVSVKKLASPFSYDSEEDAFIRKSLLLPFPSPEGPVPGFTWEKGVWRVFVHYEDWGVVSVKCKLTAMRGQVVEQIATFGGVANGQLAMVVFDMKVADEVVEVRFEKDAGDGPFVLVDYVVKYEIEGERKK